MSEEKAVQKILADQERQERLMDRQDVWKSSPYPPKPKMKPFAYQKKEFIQYTDGDKYVFRVVCLAPQKYRIGFAFKSAPSVIIGLLPRQFSQYIKRQYYRSPLTVSKILLKISIERGWKEYHE